MGSNYLRFRGWKMWSVTICNEIQLIQIKWLFESGLYEAVRYGSVELEAAK